MTNPSVSVIVPTLNGESTLRDLLPILGTQTLSPKEVILVDSGSSDGSLELAMLHGAMIKSVLPEEFQHGRSRNIGASGATGDLLVFMTQDAIPKNNACLSELASSLKEHGAAASFARQIAREGASPLEIFARAWNYPIHSRAYDSEHTKSHGIRAYFFSNVCSMVRREAFLEVGGFPENTIVNEDMGLAARLIAADKRVAYAAESIVLHSHNYGLGKTFRRYFDIGVMHRQVDGMMSGNLTSEGFNYVRALFTWLASRREYAWIPAAFAESGAKWLGLSLGKYHRRLPRFLVRRLSLHSNYWLR